jgi:competence protein ComEA
MRTELPADRVARRLNGSEVVEVSAGHEADESSEEEQPDTSLSRWLPDAASPDRPQWLTTIRADPGRAGVIALAAVGVIAVLVTVFTVTGDDPPPVVSANLPPVQMVSSTAPSGPASGDPVVVSVVGLVHRPGLVTLEPGARIDDALTAAGGVLDGADLLGLNVARRLTDGEQIVVGIAAAPGVPSAMGSSVTTGGPQAERAPSDAAGIAAAGPVNLNTATVEELDTLPGVGPVTAAAIVAFRDANGSFTDVEQLGDVDGIGPVRLDKLRDLVHV